MLYGIDPISIRIFRWDDSLKFLYPIWNSGVNESHKFLWAKIRQPGIFVAIGLPIDNLLRKALKDMALERLYYDSNDKEENNQITKRALREFIDTNEKEVEDKRIQITLEGIYKGHIKSDGQHIKYGEEGRITSPHLPGGESLYELRNRINNLNTPIKGLPEESLFLCPEMIN